MDEIGEIERIKRLAMETTNDYDKFRAINELAAYGKPAIIAIAEIGNSSNRGNIKIHALETISKINEGVTEFKKFYA